MAMALWQGMISQSGEEWRVESAGTWAAEGYPASSRTGQLLKDRGLDVSTHRSRQVTTEMLRSFNLILTMEQGHKEALQVEFPEIASRVYKLSEMSGEVHDIRDPMGGDRDDFEDTAKEIDRILTLGAEKIRSLAGGTEIP